MDDNKPDDAGTPPAGGSRKRPPPTIELTASDVSETPRPADDTAASAAASDADQSEQPTPQPEESDVQNKPSPRKLSTRSRLLLVTLLTSAAAGAFAAGLVLGAAYIAGWQNASQQPVATAPVAANDTSARADIAALNTRVAKVESSAAKPAASSVDAECQRAHRCTGKIHCLVEGRYHCDARSKRQGGCCARRSEIRTAR